MNKQFIEKIGKFHVKQTGALNHNYNLLTDEQKEMVKISVLKYHKKLTIAIQQAYFFNNVCKL